ncbi:ATP-binding protein [Negadavirga shengliensis]|uniref:ATP-binding protein n=1 Tax=Negadavirga shengliensis TaxID=1389218 RepID=A0ABV9T0D5_9BACT
MEELLELSEEKILNTALSFKRHLFSRINWTNRLIGIKGARGTGKTTLVLQWLKELNLKKNETVYVSLDDLYFTANTLLTTVRKFRQHGAKIVVLDEVHKYPNWAKEIKNLYDRYTDLKIIFTGSSVIDISRQEGDLSRRALIYELKGMSYREFLDFQYEKRLPVFTLEQLLDPGLNLRTQFDEDFKPLEFFQEYLEYGYYPFFKEDKGGYLQRLRQLVRFIVEYDMAELKGFDIRHAKKMLQLLYVVAQSVPFKPNINKLAEKTGIHRNSINNYLYFLHEAKLVELLHQAGSSMATLQKPEKIYMENTNLLFALSESPPSKGTVREVFFNNQLSGQYKVTHSPVTDFEVDNKYSFEIGGQSKGRKQIASLSKAWVVKDDLEYPVGNALPLWIFGFLY